MNDNNTIIRELQSKNKASQMDLIQAQALCKELSDKVQKLEADRKKAVELLEIVEFKTNKRFQSHVQHAIEILI